MIPLENILTVSAELFFSKLCSPDKKYKMEAVHCCDKLYLSSSGSQGDQVIKPFNQKVPSNAEYVVDYRINLVGVGTSDNYFLINQTGMALIPVTEEKKEEKKDEKKEGATFN